MPVYMVRAGEHGPVKIGFADRMEGRLVKMQADNHERLVVLRLFVGGRDEEALLHQRFSELHLHGEWHSFSKAMLGDVGLTELPALTGKSLNIYNRMEWLSARRKEVGDEQFRDEITAEDRAMLHKMARRLNAPVWQHLGLPDPNKPEA